MNWADSGRFLIVAGTVLIVVGLLLMVSDKIPFGKLPGDFQVGGGRFKIYLPVATSILLSLVLTVVFNFFARK